MSFSRAKLETHESIAKMRYRGAGGHVRRAVVRGLDESSPQRRPALAAGEWTAFAAYIVGPVLGAAAGALFYEFIRCQAPTDREVKGCC